MAIGDAFDELTRSWPNIVGGLQPRAVLAIRRELAALVHGADWDPTQILSLALTDQPVDHPVWEALAETRIRRRPGEYTKPLEISAVRLRLAIELEDPRLAVAELPLDVELEVAAEERVLIAPMADLADNVEVLDVLVIPHHGGRLAPVFQFSSSGDVLDHVGEINGLLAANEEPWGAASWWLSPHHGLHGIPADLLRHDDPEAVHHAAAAVADIP